MTTAPLRVPHAPSKAAPAREPIQFPATPAAERGPLQTSRRPARDSSFLSALIDCTKEQGQKESTAQTRVCVDPDEQRRNDDEAKIRRALAEESTRRDYERQNRLEALAQQRRDAEAQQRSQAEQQARLAEEQRRRDADEQRREAEEQARWEALEQQRRDVEAQALRAAEEQRLRDEEEQALRETEELQRRFQQELDRLAVELRRREEAEAARIDAEEQKRREAQENARLAAEECARLEAEEVRAQEEVKAEREAEERFRAAMERVRQAANERRLRENQGHEQDPESDGAAEDEQAPALNLTEEIELDYTPAATVLFKQSTPPAPGLLKRAWSWMNRKYVPAKQLRVAETISLGEKRFVAVVQVEGRKFLIGGGASGVALLTQLGDTAVPASGTNPNGGLG
jgi:hypothetical protein